MTEINPVLVLNQLLLCFSLIFPGVRLGADSQFSDFLDGLGPAQLVGRQTLATPAMGKNDMFSSFKWIIRQLTNAHMARLQHQKDFYQVSSFIVKMKVSSCHGVPIMAASKVGWETVFTPFEVLANLICNLNIGVLLPTQNYCGFSSCSSLQNLNCSEFLFTWQIIYDVTEGFWPNCTFPSLVHLTPECEFSGNICNAQ